MSGTAHTVLAPDGGLRLVSGPGRDLVFKVTGDDTGGAFDYFLCDVVAKSGPPLHIHNHQAETIHALKGRYKVRIGEETFTIEEGGFAFLPAGIPHAFFNLTDESGQVLIVFVPGGGHRFFEELGPATRGGTATREEIAAIFERHDMQLVGPPLTDD